MTCLTSVACALAAAITTHPIGDPLAPPEGPRSAEISVLTYNIHGLPWPIALGRRRALDEIGAELALLRQEGRQPDIVLIQEGFRGEMRKLVAESGYRYWAKGPARSDRAGKSRPDDGRGYHSTRYPLAGEGWGKLTSGGLHVLSDLPIVEVATTPYRYCAGLDCLANKGAMMVRVQLPDAGLDLDVVNTHMNSRRASKVPLRRSLRAHNLQTEQLLSFIKDEHDADTPLLVGGDFNVRHAPDRYGYLAPQRPYQVVSEVCGQDQDCAPKAPPAEAKPWLQSQDLQAFAQRSSGNGPPHGGRQALRPGRRQAGPFRPRRLPRALPAELEPCGHGRCSAAEGFRGQDHLPEGRGENRLAALRPGGTGHVHRRFFQATKNRPPLRRMVRMVGGSKPIHRRTTMAEPQAANPTQTSEARRPPGAAEGAPRAEGEPRPFAPAQQRIGEESVRTAKDLSRSAAQTTKDMGERTRQAARDLTTDWRGAMEPFLALQMDLNRWVDDFWRNAVGLSAGAPLRLARPMSMPSPAPLLGLPPTDLRETDTAYVLCSELPGLTRQDVDLQIRGDALVISGHKSEGKDDAGAAYRISERRFGRFERSLPIPPDVRREGIEANFRDGVLTVTLPKTQEAAQPGSKIEIRE